MSCKQLCLKDLYHGFCAQIHCFLSPEFLFVIFVTQQVGLDFETCLGWKSPKTVYTDCFCMCFCKACWYLGYYWVCNSVSSQPFWICCVICRGVSTPVCCLVHWEILFLYLGEWGTASELPVQAPNSLAWAEFFLGWIVLWERSFLMAEPHNLRLFSWTV